MLNERSNSISENVPAGVRWTVTKLGWGKPRKGVVESLELGAVWKVPANLSRAAAKQCRTLSEIDVREIVGLGSLDALLPLQKECLVIGQSLVSVDFGRVLPSLAVALGTERVPPPTDDDTRRKRDDDRKGFHCSVLLLLLSVSLWIGYFAREVWMARKRPNDPKISDSRSRQPGCGDMEGGGQQPG
jgi:hypothetical protein